MIFRCNPFLLLLVIYGLKSDKDALLYVTYRLYTPLNTQKSEILWNDDVVQICVSTQFEGFLLTKTCLFLITLQRYKKNCTYASFCLQNVQFLQKSFSVPSRF